MITTEEQRRFLRAVGAMIRALPVGKEQTPFRVAEIARWAKLTTAEASSTSGIA
jgi:hypothetical protein